MKKNNFLAFIIITFILIVLCYEMTLDYKLTKENVLNVFFYDILSAVVYLFSYEKEKLIKGQFFRITPIFLLGFIIVCFQIDLDFILGNYPNFGHDYMIDNSVVVKCQIVSSIALHSFFLGSLISQRNKKTIENKDFDLTRVILNNKLPTKILLILAYIFFVVFMITVDKRYFNGGYGPEEFGGVELKGITAYANQYFLYSIMGYIIVVTRNAIISNYNNKGFFKFYFKNFEKSALLIIVLYILLIFMSGDRGSVIQLLLCMMASYVITNKKKVNYLMAFFMIIVASFIISFLGYFREFKEAKTIAEKIKMANERSEDLSSRSKSFLKPTLELAASVRTLHAAGSYVKNEGHTNGVFQAVQILGILPGAGILVQRIFGIDFTEFKSTTLVTHYIFGPFPTHSLGTSAVGDIYLDFGAVGVLILFFIFGYMVRYVEIRIFSKHLATLFVFVIFFVFLSKAIYIGRSTIVILFREIIQLYIVIRLSLYVSGVNSLKKY